MPLNKPESRTTKSIKNAKIALLFYFVNLVLQFFSRKIFLEYLGAEILGLNTTAQNLLGFLNLAELGIGGAIAYTLYKPLYENNTEAINGIVSVQGWLYRRVAYVIIVAACILMCFFPVIFEKAQVPLWYTYGSFIVLLTGAMLGYFVNYRQIVLTADQKEYKITLNIQGFKIVKVLLQILAIRYLQNGYVYWMALELLMSVVAALILNRVLNREYPWLKPQPACGKELRKTYPEILSKTKLIFFQKIANIVLAETSPLIIYAYTSLTVVAVYGNYMLIIAGVTLLMKALLSSVNAGVGNLVAEGDMKRIKLVFWEMTVCRIWLASLICFGIYELADSFITLWVGEQFVIGQPTLIVLIVITFITLSRTNEVFLSAYGLFHDIGSPVVETILNLGGSVLMGYYYGLTGILSGVMVSLVVIACCWKPYFLYSCGFKENFSEYAYRYIKFLILIGVAVICSVFLLDRLFCDFSVDNYWDWLKYASVAVIVYVVLSLLLFYFWDESTRCLVRRIKTIVTG